MPNSKRDHFLIFRGLFAIFIVWWHLGTPPLILNKLDISFIYTIPGRFSVWMFFCLSGYLLGKGFLIGKYNLNKNSIKKFYVSRAYRILPLYYFSFLFLWITIYPNSYSSYSYKAIFQALTLLKFEARHIYPFNGVYWFLLVIIQFYVVAPFICTAILRISNIKKAMAFISLYSFIIYLLLGSLADSRSLVGNLMFFMFGILGNTLIRDYKDILLKRKIIKKVSIGIALYFWWNWFIYLNLNFLFWCPLNVILTGIFGMLLMVVLEYLNTNNSISSQLDFLLNWLGRLSFGIYVWHSPTLSYVLNILSYTTNWRELEPCQFLLAFVIIIVSTTLIALLSYFLIEVPFMKIKTRSCRQLFTTH